MGIKEIWWDLNFIARCREYRISLWQCPHFIFILMGMLIIASMLGSYAIANFYNQEPEIVIIIITLVTAALLILDFVIIDNFEKLAHINRLESEFISVASHQLRTPLASLKWTLGFLMENWEALSSEKRQNYLEEIKNGNERMIQLVNNLLDVSRIDFNALRVSFAEEVSLPILSQKIIKILEPLAQANRVTIQLEVEPDLPSVKGDPEYLELVVQNLIDNAIKYIKDGGTVWVKIEKENNHLKFSVKDTGVGIPKGQQRQIFHKFFRAENIMHRQVNGSGLGLFLTQAVIKAHRGRIGFQSKEGEGSTFWFGLPIQK